MPITQLELPILAHFLCAVASTTGEPVMDAMSAPPQQQQRQSARAAADSNNDDDDSRPLPKGVVIGPDGKPCRSCTSAASWKAMMSRATTSHAPPAAAPPAPSASPPADCPADVEALGRSSWTLLHSMAAQYPARPTAAQQADTRQFLGLFAQLYPCWACAADFRAWMGGAGNAPRLSSRDEFARWMCDAHNAVNAKLGKARFDCARWEERWRTGWRDGRCD